MKKPKLSPSEADILYGMAKGPWASFWADREEEKGKSFSQQNIYDLCPKPPAKAKAWAKKLALEIITLNNSSLTDMLTVAQGEGFKGDPEEFGFYLGCQASGMGIAWDDDCSTNVKFKIPQREFYV
jgi:hypothetical protein